MRFPFASRVWLLLGLLLLTLMQVAVYGIIPMEMHQSPGDQSRTSQQKAQENVQAGEDQQLERMIRYGSTPVTPSSLSAEQTFKPFFLMFPTISDEESIDDVIDSSPWNNTHKEEGAEEKSRVYRAIEEKILYPGVKTYTPVMNLCQKWFSCNYQGFTKIVKSLQENLPSCPCTYISVARVRAVSVFDQGLGRTFYWKSNKNRKEDTSDYHPSAGRCLRSLREENSTSVASQLCCYSSNGRLFTRGKWAGFPQLISPDFSPQLHFKVDREAWNFCEKDWSLFHFIFPPNNGLSCPQHPSDARYEAQLREVSKN